MSDANALDAAIEALESATDSLDEQRRVQKIRTAVEALVVVLLGALLLVVYLNGEEKDREICEAINDGRASTRGVLIEAIKRGADDRTPQEQAEAEDFLHQLEKTFLRDLDCE